MDSSRGQGSISGQEERDMLFARLFGFTAVVQSGLLFRTNPLPSSMSSDAAPADLESYEEYLAELLAVGEKKSWLRESAWWTLILVVDALEQSEVDWKDAAKDVTLSKVFAADVVWSPEKIAMTLKMQAKYPSENWRDFLAPTFKHGNPLHVGNLVPLARILKVRRNPLLATSADFGLSGILGRRRRRRGWRQGVHRLLEATTALRLGYYS
jgi:DNA polymerase phi